jgi:hypothetical protein
MTTFIAAGYRRPDGLVAVMPSTTSSFLRYGVENEPLLLLGALQHDQLMTKREDLGLRGGVSSKAGN